MDNRLLEERKKKQKENEAMDMLIDMMAETIGDKSFILFKSYNDAHRSMQQIIDNLADKKMTEEQKDNAILIFNQFEKITKDFLKTIKNN